MKFFRIFGFAIVGVALLTVLMSCSEEKSPTDINTHPDGWNNVNSAVFHGKKVEANHGIDNCLACHGETLDDGGESGVACADCHNTRQEDGPLANHDPINHKILVQNSGWDLESCAYCHSDNYKGNDLTGDCTTCHTNDAGPEACNTCHGDFAAADPLEATDIAPPADLYGETRPFSTGVGLHNYHVTSGVSCNLCHASPVNSFDDPSHIDGDGIAEVNPDFIRTWDRDNGTCTTGCHVQDGEFVEKQWTY